MTALEHEVAIYYEVDLTRREIPAYSLSNSAVLAEAKSKELWDKSGQKRLQARGGTDIRAHFYELPGSPVSRAIFEGEKDKAHNDRVDYLLGKLKTSKKLEMVIAHPARAGVEQIDLLFTLRDYEWRTEVHRVLNVDAIVRHDIFGQRLELEMSINRPWVAIEVINTHYPDERAFAAMLAASKNYPMIVLFDFTAHPNTFVKIDMPTKRLRIRPWSFYIKDGALWKGDSPTAIQTSILFQIELEKMLAAWVASRAR